MAVDTVTVRVELDVKVPMSYIAEKLEYLLDGDYQPEERPEVGSPDYEALVEKLMTEAVFDDCLWANDDFTAPPVDMQVI